MAKACDVEIFVAVDESGDHIVASDRDDLDLSSLGDSTRIVRVVLTVPLPVLVTLKGVVPPEGEATLTVS